MRDQIVLHSNDNVEVGAVLVPLAIQPDNLHGVATDLSKMPAVRRAAWTMSALE